ncbi:MULTISPECIES: hypothetical protein [Pseudomonas]|uniref:Uncharacterized protein n=1 Tax=Pseudomonas helleri TaxID=1608996 RepID=A0A7X2BWF6_9PSED|nr:MULTISPECIES: hypothetical protein [Pseudomonas]MBM1204773.1 hypothetical protein [Pseudomonas fragi]MBM1204869.1 hypothetical protein [Pseudomonas fragi]MQT77663.1 hypothetical protein [Pseudomonas helleri]NMY57949.1 hypothetical protein [Pseudomonas sp. WS 5051]
MIDTLESVRKELARIRAQLAGAEAVLARIRAHGDPLLAEKEASTRLLIEALGVQAESLAQQLSDRPARVLH